MSQLHAALQTLMAVLAARARTWPILPEPAQTYPPLALATNAPATPGTCGMPTPGGVMVRTTHEQQQHDLLMVMQYISVLSQAADLHVGYSKLTLAQEH